MTKGAETRAKLERAYHRVRLGRQAKNVPTGTKLSILAVARSRSKRRPHPHKVPRHCRDHPGSTRQVACPATRREERADWRFAAADARASGRLVREGQPNREVG